MSRPLKTKPKFKDEAAERAFWEASANDSSQYVDWGRAELVELRNLRPSTQTISLRLPKELLETIRSHARKLDVPYQSLMKLWLAERAAGGLRQRQTKKAS